jgi:ABC-type multidrug transport system fused ATPase/permease subunit
VTSRSFISSVSTVVNSGATPIFADVDLNSQNITAESINKTNLHSWQTSIGYVPQSGFVADGTIARNIAFGVPENKINMERVRDMAQITQISAFIENELPQQYEI